MEKLRSEHSGKLVKKENETLKEINNINNAAVRNIRKKIDMDINN